LDQTLVQEERFAERIPDRETVEAGEAPFEPTLQIDGHRAD
jgi:hypothetical protein